MNQFAILFAERFVQRVE